MMVLYDGTAIMMVAVLMLFAAACLGLTAAVGAQRAELKRKDRRIRRLREGMRACGRADFRGGFESAAERGNQSEQGGGEK